MSTGQPKSPYVLEKMLGRGGMAEVYLARAPDGNRFCIKQIRAEHSDDSDFVEMFRREARIASALDHVNIVKTYEFNEDDERLQLVMEYVDGFDLRKMLRTLNSAGMSVPVAVAITVMKNLLQALKAAHEMYMDGQLRPVIHRDVSPHNILLSLGGEVKLADFGIAKMKDTSGLTRTGVIKGKLVYLSPEQAAGEPISPSADLYCAGLVFFEMLTGRRFHGGANESEILASVMRDRIPQITWLSDPLNAFLGRLLQRHPENRFASAAEALKALASLGISHSSTEECALCFQSTFSMGEPSPVQYGAEREAPTVASGDRPSDDIVTRTSRQDILHRPAHRWWNAAARASMITLASVAVIAIMFLYLRHEPEAHLKPAAEIEKESSENTAPISDRTENQPASSVTEKKTSGPSFPIIPSSVIETGVETGVETAAVAMPESPPGLDAPSSPKPTVLSSGGGEEKPARSATGILEVNCRPWAEVFIGRRSYGTTPVRDISLKEGVHPVRLVNEALGVDKRISVSIRAGETTRVVEQLP